MLNKVKGLLNVAKQCAPKVSWQSESEEINSLKEQRDNLLTIATQYQNINQALNIALGQSLQKNEILKEEAVVLLKAIAMQYNGELVIKSEFFDILKDSENNQLSLKIERQDDRSVILKVVEEDEDVCNKEEGEI